MADLIDRDALLKDLRSECHESDVCISSAACIDCIVNRQPAVESDYEQGFKDGLKSECVKELKPIMVELAKGCTEAINGITPMMIENAHLHITSAVNRWIPVEDALPEKAGVYLVTYHPCYWDHVEWSKRCTGIDTFRGKSTWAKKKYQHVIAWMPMPNAYEPPEVTQDD